MVCFIVFSLVVGRGNLSPVSPVVYHTFLLPVNRFFSKTKPGLIFRLTISVRWVMLPPSPTKGIPMKASQDSPASRAARILGRIRSDRKSAASRKNGRLGGRPASGVCTERVLRQRVRSFLRQKGEPMADIRYWQDWACRVRSDIVSHRRPLSEVLEWSSSTDYHRRFLSRLLPSTPLLL